MAVLLKTSRVQVNRLLGPNHNPSGVENPWNVWEEGRLAVCPQE